MAVHVVVILRKAPWFQDKVFHDVCLLEGEQSLGLEMEVKGMAKTKVEGFCKQFCEFKPHYFEYHYKYLGFDDAVQLGGKEGHENKVYIRGRHERSAGCRHFP